jgi:opacity protein-like surface antigen
MGVGSNADPKTGKPIKSGARSGLSKAALAQGPIPDAQSGRQICADSNQEIIQMNCIPCKTLAARLNIFGAVLLIACGTSVRVSAAEADSESQDDWEVHVGLPFWAFGVKHTVGLSGREAEVDEDFSDVFDILDFAGGLNLEMRQSRWLLFANSLYAKVSADAEPGGLLSGIVDEVDLTTKEFDLDFGLGYDVVPGRHFSLEPFVGGRVTYVETELEAGSGGSFSRSRAWADPIFGGVATFRLGSHFALLAEADIGGFGVSSDLTWQVQGGLEFNILRWPYVRLAYRHQETDFEDGGFKYDIKKSGPVLELGLRF